MEKLKLNPQSARQKVVDNYLKILNDLNKASLDMRLINPLLSRDPNGKIAKMTECP